MAKKAKKAKKVAGGGPAKARGAKRGGRKPDPLSTARVTKPLEAWIKAARKAMGKYPQLSPKVNEAEAFLESMRCAERADGVSDHVPITR